MQATWDLLRYVNIGAFALLALVAFVQLRRGRHPGSKWVFATFSSLALVAIAGLLLPDDSDAAWFEWAQRVLVSVLVLFPYLLYRVSATFLPTNRLLEALAGGLTVGIIVWSFLIMFPPPDAERTQAFDLYIVGLLVQWVTLSIVVAARFWRAGRGQPSIARRRMRMLSLASIAMSIALIIAGAVPGDRPIVGVVTQAIAFVAVAAFYVAFAPPSWLRTLWRRPVQEAMREATIELMSAGDEHEVANTILPYGTTITGAEGIAVIDARGETIGAYGFDPGSLKEARVLLDAAAEESGNLRTDLVSFRYKFGWLLVKTGPYTTFFGQDEVLLLGALGALANLAIERLRADELRVMVAQAEQRREQALEINDNIVQGLAVAKYAMEMGQPDRAQKAVENTLAAARKIISELVEEIDEDMQLGPGTLTRGRAAGGFKEPSGDPAEEAG